MIIFPTFLYPLQANLKVGKYSSPSVPMQVAGGITLGPLVDLPVALRCIHRTIHISVSKGPRLAGTAVDVYTNGCHAEQTQRRSAILYSAAAVMCHGAVSAWKPYLPPHPSQSGWEWEWPLTQLAVDIRTTSARGPKLTKSHLLWAGERTADPHPATQEVNGAF